MVTRRPRSISSPVPSLRLPNAGEAYHWLCQAGPALLLMAASAVCGLSPVPAPPGPNVSTLARARSFDGGVAACVGEGVGVGEGGGALGLFGVLGTADVWREPCPAAAATPDAWLACPAAATACWPDDLPT